MRDTAPTRFTPVGSSSIVFKMQLADGSAASFRPRARIYSGGWRGEIAAYRLSRALGMDQVPLAVARRISRTDLDARIASDARDKLLELERVMIWDDEEGETVVGTAVPWVPNLRDLGLDTSAGVERWAAWLRHDGAIANDRERVLARDMSIMLAFDELIANFDRFSGANVRGNEDSTRVVIRDHNLAFVSPLLDPQREAIERRFNRVERFSRSFVMRLRGLDRATIERALAPDPLMPDVPILDDGQLSDLLVRRDLILSRVEALISSYGEAAVFAFN